MSADLVQHVLDNLPPHVPDAFERVADSLTKSAKIFRDRGQHFSADFTENMIEPARQWPELYRHWAIAQAERANQGDKA